MAATVVQISNLPFNSEPAYVARSFGKRNIQEIFTFAGGSKTAWVVFETKEDALALIEHWNSVLFGPSHQGARLAIRIVPEEEIPGRALMRYSDHVRERNEAVQTRTVVVRNLPPAHPISNILEMFEPFEGWIIDDEYATIEHTFIIGHGEVMVQFENVGTACQFVTDYDGEYWKNATINAKFVPDSEIEDLIQERKARKGKTAMLMVNNVKPHMNADWICEAFAPFKVNDVNIPGGDKKFLFVFMDEGEAAKLFARYPSGKINHKRNWIFVKSSDKKKKGMSAREADPQANEPCSTGPTHGEDLSTLATMASSMSLKPNKDNKGAAAKSTGTSGVIITNLPLMARKPDVQPLFNATFNVTKLAIPKGKGIAYVGFESEQEAQRAIKLVSGKKVLGRAIRAELNTNS